MELSRNLKRLQSETSLRDYKFREQKVKRLESIERQISKMPAYLPNEDLPLSKQRVNIKSCSSLSQSEDGENLGGGLLSKDKGTFALVQKLQQEKYDFPLQKPEPSQVLDVGQESELSAYITRNHHSACLPHLSVDSLSNRVCTSAENGRILCINDEQDASFTFKQSTPKPSSSHVTLISAESLKGQENMTQNRQQRYSDALDKFINKKKPLNRLKKAQTMLQTYLENESRWITDSRKVVLAVQSRLPGQVAKQSLDELLHL